MNFLPPCKPSQKWLSILETYNLKQIVNEPTGVTKDSKTLVDYIYITNLEKLQARIDNHFCDGLQGGKKFMLKQYQN
jgi:hypothetical protein